MSENLKGVITQGDVKFWITIIIIISSITAWGIRLETRLDYLTQILEKQNQREELLTDSLNRVWKEVAYINALVGKR